MTAVEARKLLGLEWFAFRVLILAALYGGGLLPAVALPAWGI